MTWTADYDKIRSTFRKSPVIQSHYRVAFRLKSTEPIAVASDLLGGKRADYLYFTCPYNSVDLSDFASDSFPASTANTTDGFSIANCDLQQFSFDFLKSFTSISHLDLYGSPLSTFKSMPHLPSLYSVQLSNCPGLQQWYPLSQTPNLNGIAITYSDLSDAQIDAIFDSMDDKNNTHTGQLTGLDLWGTKLTRVPPFVLSLPSLVELNMESNHIKSLPSGSLNFTSNELCDLNLQHNEIETIAPGAFGQGLYTNYLK